MGRRQDTSRDFKLQKNPLAKELRFRVKRGRRGMKGKEKQAPVQSW